MSTVLEQLGIDNTLFVELALFAGLYVVLKFLYFDPFLKLIDLRHKKTIEDGEQAARLMADAQKKLDEYTEVLTREKLAARKDFDAIIQETKKEEAKILGEARNEAKKITQEALEELQKQREQIREKLKGDAEQLSKLVVEKVLAG